MRPLRYNGMIAVPTYRCFWPQCPHMNSSLFYVQCLLNYLTIFMFKALRDIQDVFQCPLVSGNRNRTYESALYLSVSMHCCIQNKCMQLVQNTNNYQGYHWKKFTGQFSWLFFKRTSSSLSLSDPALHRDWLDDSLLAELWKTQQTWLISPMFFFLKVDHVRQCFLKFLYLVPPQKILNSPSTTITTDINI